MSGKLHNLYEYQFALKLTKELPEAMKALDKCKELLYPYKDYLDVAKCIQQMEEAYMLLEVTNEVYKIKVEDKGEQ